jgi:hypothetical protein
MRWATAVKLWNVHKKIYDIKHVYAIPRKGTAEYDDVKHVMAHEALPKHLEKKAPMPAKVLEQLREAEAAAKARREAAKESGGRKEIAEAVKEVLKGNEKPKRVLSEEHLAKMKAGREAAKAAKTGKAVEKVEEKPVAKKVEKKEKLDIKVPPMPKRIANVLETVKVEPKKEKKAKKPKGRTAMEQIQDELLLELSKSEPNEDKVRYIRGILERYGVVSP